MSLTTTERQDMAIPEPSAAQSVLSIIARAATDPSVNIEKMQALLDMQERISAKQAEQEFNTAFARLSGKLPRIKRDGCVAYEDKKTGELVKAFKFATWEAIMLNIQPLLADEGFTLSFESAPRQGDGGGLMVTGTLSHAGGHSRSATIPLPLDNSGGKNNLQGYGSTFSYGRRYTATMLLNIVTEGEDSGGGMPGAKISDEQRQELLDLVADTKSDFKKFLAWLGVGELTDLPATSFLKAKSQLIAKQKQAAA